MKLFLPVLFLGFCLPALAQDLNGQWRGSFTDATFGNSVASPTDYVLEFSVNGANLSGSSYTYYYDNGNKIYSICAVTGTIDSKNNSITVREIKRIKTNAPGNAQGFQQHILYYSVINGEQRLQGKWSDVNNVTDAHWGYTNLSKKTLQSLPQLVKLSENKEIKKDAEEITHISKILVPKKDPINRQSITLRPKEIETKDILLFTHEKIHPIFPPAEIIFPFGEEINKSIRTRSNQLQQIILITHKLVKIELYDNGEVDGDSVSLYYNNKLLLSHAGLSEKPISLMLDIECDSLATNELVMYAENLGTIPPNTALLVITDGNKRYELRVSSDLEKSGSVRFIRKEK